MVGTVASCRTMLSLKAAAAFSSSVIVMWEYKPNVSRETRTPHWQVICYLHIGNKLNVLKNSNYKPNQYAAYGPRLGVKWLPEPLT